MTDAHNADELPTKDAIEAFCERLSRDPDFDAEELRAFDAADVLLLDQAGEAIQAASPGELAIIGDRHGALTLGAAQLYGASQIRTHQDPVLGERALAENAQRAGLTEHYSSQPLNSELLSGARVVLIQLPRGLEALTEIVWAIAAFAHPEVRVFAGGREKHMSRRMNEVLAERLDNVTAGLGWRKSRVLSAVGVRELGTDAAGLAAAPFPKWGSDPALEFQVAAFGQTFGGPTLDHGSRLLLETLRAHPPHRTQHVVDLGCGNGVLAVSAVRSWPHASVIATDQSAAAVAATELTAAAAGVADRVNPHRGDALEAVADGWANLILLNPPFHTGATVHAGVAHRLIRQCTRALAAGGELRVVFNSHLRYRPLIERAVGPTRELARDRTFTVLSARARD
ncbi:16S rRNA (guanine1207-N2)-methyltransferase [Leucobacter exalbidus]|uniref:16S rRNA (Guanine1207-N2)-methyltransferase n=1 Tax=Leucobacter exalbidus TaxID=662960 RepID=A0A940T6E2_9MICO|nr:methyltransferase [Leucobacter exalbidus]MBP1326911.1 16S rRNA (guanine1207-N2)-methyltransferase [Leucobacter exalbidus]